MEHLNKIHHNVLFITLLEYILYSSVYAYTLIQIELNTYNIIYVYQYTFNVFFYLKFYV